MDARAYMMKLVVCAALLCGLSAACSSRSSEEARRPPDCPESRRVASPLVEEPLQELDYWLARAETYGSLDRPLLDEAALERRRVALRQPTAEDPVGQVDLETPVDREALQRQLLERLDYLRDKLQSHELVDRHGEPVSAHAIEAFQPREEFDSSRAELRKAQSLVALRCGPYGGGLYQSPVDLDFDRNRCSTLRPGEVVELLGRWGPDLWVARTPYALGWLEESDSLEPIPPEDVAAVLGPEVVKPFTRRAVLAEAFDLLGAPYGWGGKDGGYDCSRFLLELFGRFGIDLPRHSARQAEAGTFSLDVSGVEDPDEKLLLFEAAARRGIALLYFPGHIMLYLGTTKEGVPMVMHAFSEYLTTCEGTDLETVNRVDRVAISDLSLGQGSSRGDFLSRVSTITVFGRPPGAALVGDAELRGAAPGTRPEGSCRDSNRHALFRSPSRPHIGQPLRVIATSERDPGIASLTLYGPSGERVRATEHRLDGPPFSRFVEIETPDVGRWTAVLGEGDHVLACERFTVARSSPKPLPRAPSAPAWETTRAWNRSTENLYSAFIEQLFREPLAEDATWTRLQELIGDRDHNLLYDHHLVGEDARLSLEPDCADLPYFLRAYFAWKLRLPFAYRSCSRGRPNAPPVCEAEVVSHLDPITAATDAGAFRVFARRMAGVVHSSSPRTLPSDEHTDVYPLPLRRGSLRPGTVFADPYGHVLVVARWKPQGVSDYGVLIGGDAQPDGTVGRRRFWRGSFLFTPETEVVGAGFKGWRPVAVDPSTGELHIADNESLRSAGLRAWSDAQYQGSKDDFYVAVEGMINPRPLDPLRRQASLVDALEESVQRRLSSVNNGEEFMAGRDYLPIEMPRGRAIFLTTGPWEDYSTPSRDMRLLISIDAVTSFPDTVRSHPRRFGVREEDLEATVDAVRATLAEELSERRFTYRRSDQSTWSLTLADLVDRAAALEVAYNPNDCVELRWGAPENSEERSSCARRAPADQSARMEKYRGWFEKRTRPH